MIAHLKAPVSYNSSEMVLISEFVSAYCAIA